MLYSPTILDGSEISLPYADCLLGIQPLTLELGFAVIQIPSIQCSLATQLSTVNNQDAIAIPLMACVVAIPSVTTISTTAISLPILATKVGVYQLDVLKSPVYGSQRRVPNPYSEKEMRAFAKKLCSGVSGSFVSADGRSITVQDGLIIGIV